MTSVVQPLDQGVIATFKMCYKRKLVAWTLQQIDNNSNEDLGRLNVDLFQAMLWCMAAWHVELEVPTVGTHTLKGSTKSDMVFRMRGN